MNTIDIIICVILLYALIKGWSGGILVQIAGIIAILAGFWAATFCSDYVAKLLNMESASHQLIYIVTLIIVMVLVACLLKFIDKLLKSVGLSLVIRILGVVFSVGKWVILLSLLLSVYLTTIKTWHITPAKTVTESIFFEPFKYVDKNFFPYLAHAKKLLPKTEKKSQDKHDIIDQENNPDNNIPENNTRDSIPVITNLETI